MLLHCFQDGLECGDVARVQSLLPLVASIAATAATQAPNGSPSSLPSPPPPSAFLSCFFRALLLCVSRHCRPLLSSQPTLARRLFADVLHPLSRAVGGGAEGGTEDEEVTAGEEAMASVVAATSASAEPWPRALLWDAWRLCREEVEAEAREAIEQRLQAR